MKNHVLILAGGKGTRMQSEMPKVLVPVNGVPMLQHLTNNISKVISNISIVVGYRGEDVVTAMGDGYNYVWQHEQLGTGHAVNCARASLEHAPIESLVVLSGDHPFVGGDTVTGMVQSRESINGAVCIATIRVPHFEGLYSPFLKYGRIVRDNRGKIQRIVEYKDATEAEKAITEVNSSYYAFNPEWLWANIDLITADNNAHEFYLTDLIERAVIQQLPIASFEIQDPVEGMGANTREHIEVLEQLKV